MQFYPYMKQAGKHSTNYYNAFIEVAEDCPALQGEIPQAKGDKKTVALMQFEKIAKHPYVYTSDDLLFGIFAERGELGEAELEAEREKFFSKGQACLRSSPLGKRYGWGIHFNAEGKVAIYPRESGEYIRFRDDPALEHTRAMRSKRA